MQDYSRLEVERLGRKGLNKTVHNLVDVQAHLGVFNNPHVRAHHYVKLVAHLLFVLDGDAAEKEGLGRYGHKLG